MRGHRMKNRTRNTVYALVAVVLVATLGLLAMQARSFDFDAQREIVGTLRDLKQIDAEWNVDVLRARTGLANNYDRVASPLPLIASLERALTAKSARLWGDRPESQARLGALLAAFSRLMGEKTAAIEQFKSQNAILRNSSRFLPLAVSELAQTVRESDGVPAGARQAFESSLSGLLADLMTYDAAPGAEPRQRIAERAAGLSHAAKALPPQIGDMAETMLAHMRTVLAQQEAGVQLLAEIDKLDTARAIDALADAYAAENAHELAAQQTHRYLLIGYAVFLLLLLGYAALRVVRSYRLLNRANAALTAANREIKAAQVQMIQSEKMSALGQMVAGIAHEINTPLAYVKGTLGVLQEQLPPIRDLSVRSHAFVRLLRAAPHDAAALNRILLGIEARVNDMVELGLLSEMDGLLNDGLHGIDQISEIVLNLKNFARLDRAKVSDFSVEAGLDSTLVLANNMLKNKVTVRKEYGGVPAISGSPSQINQVFLNLITNAVQAMPVRAGENVITLRTAREDEHTVRVEIEDNGSGIPKDVVPRIFDPFFTTKPVGEGTGMGLSISFQIVQAHGGRLLVDSEDGVGTVFTVLLPIQAAPAPQPIEHDGGDPLASII